MTMYRAQLRWQPVVVLMVIAITWGANMAFIKFAARDVAPLFMAGLRSLVAGVIILLWMRIRGLALFPGATVVAHGVVAGLLFGAEFALIYLGLQETLASRTYVFVYTAPFFVALGAHCFLKDDRLSRSKVTGLILAFTGVAFLFLRNLGPLTDGMLRGDLMALGGGVLWAATTIYIKRFLVGRALPLQMVFYQLIFSAPLLLALSFCTENPVISGFSLLTGISLFYQCVIVASITFIVWFEMIHRYPVSLLHAFTFFVPVFGVSISGALMLGEVITIRLVVALGLVGLGMVLVNYRPAGTPAAQRPAANSAVSPNEDGPDRALRGEVIAPLPRAASPAGRQIPTKRRGPETDR